MFRSTGEFESVSTGAESSFICASRSGTGGKENPLGQISILGGIRKTSPGLETVGKVFPKQLNGFGFIIEKTKKLHPWLDEASNCQVHQSNIQAASKTRRKEPSL